MDRLLWKKKAFGGKNKWWLSGGLTTADVIAAYQFSKCFSEDDALTNLNDPETFKLEKRWNDLKPLTEPLWDRKTGFEIKQVDNTLDLSYLYNDDLFATDADSPASQIKAIFACYSGLDTTQNRGASLASFWFTRGNATICKTLYAMAMEVDDDRNPYYYKCPGMIKRDIHLQNEYNYVFITETAKQKGVIGFAEKDSEEKFYVEGKVTELTRKGRDAAVAGKGIGNANTRYSIGFYIKAVAIYKSELTAQQALAISSAMKSFL